MTLYRVKRRISLQNRSLLRVQRVGSSTVDEKKIQRPSSDPIKKTTTKFYLENVKSLPRPREYSTEQAIYKSKISHPVVYVHRIDRSSSVQRKIDDLNAESSHRVYSPTLVKNRISPEITRLPVKFEKTSPRDVYVLDSSSKTEELQNSKQRRSFGTSAVTSHCCCLLTALVLGAVLLLALEVAIILLGTLNTKITSTEATVVADTMTTVTTTTSTSATITATMTTSIIITTLTTTTETTTVCSPTASGRGTFFSLNGTTPTTWTLYELNYTATITNPILAFGFQTENNREYYLDSVSVVDQGAPSIELLQNPSFENSTITTTNWVRWCSSTCTSGGGVIFANSSCHLSAGNCFVENCFAGSGIEFLGQSFAASIGNIYKVSFYLLADGSGTAVSNRFYVDIL